MPLPSTKRACTVLSTANLVDDSSATNSLGHENFYHVEHFSLQIISAGPFYEINVTSFCSGISYIRYRLQWLSLFQWRQREWRHEYSSAQRTLRSIPRCWYISYQRHIIFQYSLNVLPYGTLSVTKLSRRISREKIRREYFATENHAYGKTYSERQHISKR